MAPDTIPAKKSVVERALSVITDVHAGEGPRTLLLGLNVFVLLLSYYVLRVVREPLILTEGGAEVKSYSAALQALVLIGVVPVYAWCAAHFNRISLITYATLFFVVNLLMFAASGFAGLHVGVVFYVWIGIFNMLVVAQFWAFANDLHTEAAGKRLFAVIMLCANLGAAAGGQVAGLMAKPLGPYGSMLLAAGLLLVCIAISRVINSRAVKVQRAAEIPLPDTGVLTILARDKYLQLIALLMVLLNLVNTTGNFLLDRFLTAEAARLAGADIAAQRVIITEFTGDVASIFSVLGMVLQFFFVSRIFRYAGVGAAILILPVIALTGYSMILAMPLLGVIKWVKIFENGTNYSIQNTALQALYLPTSREAKYKAKAAIDTFFVRSGDVLSAALVYAGTHWVILSVKGFAGVNLALTLVWLAVAAVIAREYKKRTEPVTVQRSAADVQGAIA